MRDTKETAILIDHETDTVLVDTNVRSVVSLLKTRGFIEKDDPRAKPYRRFHGRISQISFRRGQSAGRAKKMQNNVKNGKTTERKRC